MQSRHAAAQNQLDELIRDITDAGRVYQGGASEIFGDSLDKKLQTGANASLARLFGEYGDGDHKSWGVALKRARDGSDEPLKIVGWDKATEDHPVVRRVMTEIGNGAKGGEIRKTLQASPYGWPRDAIDAALIALHRNGTIRAELNRQPVAPGHLDQNKISTTEFYPEKVRLSASDKLALRGLFQKAGLSVKRGEEEIKVREFLAVPSTLASEAGGEAPLPAAPSTTVIDELATLHGSEQLGAILEKMDELQVSIKAWTKIRDRIKVRKPPWEQLERLANHAKTLPVHAEIGPEIEAIMTNRSLLDDTDHVMPLKTKTANALRAALTEQTEALQTAYDTGLEILTADSSWQQLDDATTSSILSLVGLTPPNPPVTRTDEDVLCELDKASLDARASTVAAVSARVTHALEEAARRLRPEARRITIRTATLEDEGAVRAWIKEHESKLLEGVAHGPVIVG